MFKTDPQYIVAGEIVRTTRMYAMSVSPLSGSVLERISGELFEALGGKAPATGEGLSGGKIKRARDFTNNIKIGQELFEIETIKGKKQAVLPWERFSGIKDDVGGKDAVYKGLRGVITLDGRYTILAGEKLSLILSLAPSLDIEGALSRSWPRNKRFNSRENLPALLEQLPLILAPALWKPHADTKGKKELGFLCLFTDGTGNYWFTCSRGFHTSLNESLASVESLIDELGEELDIEIKHIVNQTYRRLSEYLG
jgi:hypothetical protein